MVSGKKITVKVPASTANLGPAFDSIGMAFQLYTSVTAQRAPETTVRVYGEELKDLPADKSNLIYQVMEKVFSTVGEPMPELSISVESKIPLTRGLGSSASAIVAALLAANRLVESPLPTEDIYHMASVMEAHPDNVGASLFGGIVVATIEQRQTPYIRLTPPNELKVVAAIPDYPLLTHQARNVLPETYNRKDVVHSISHSSLLVAALATGQLDLLTHAMQDRVHQPYRASLMPGMEMILNEAPNHGALGAALSGAGPTLIAFATDGEKDLKAFMEASFQEYDVPCRVVSLAPDLEGAQVYEYVDILSNP